MSDSYHSYWATLYFHNPDNDPDHEKMFGYIHICTLGGQGFVKIQPDENDITFYYPIGEIKRIEVKRGQFLASENTP